MAMSHGMDIGEVRRLGGSLQTSAGSIDDLIKRIETAIAGPAWVGRDASTFRGTWWPEHRAHLKEMSETLHGLGQSALNNASEQEQASGVSGGVAGGAPTESETPPSVSEVPQGPGTSIEMPQDGNLRSRFVEFWNVDGRVPGFDRNGFTNGSGGNCTSYVAWRLNDLAHENGLDWSINNWTIGGATIGNYVADGGTYGGQGLARLSDAMYWSDAAATLESPTDGIPTPGSVAWWSSEGSDSAFGQDAGHVAVVTSVDPSSGAVTVEESSYGGEAFKVTTYQKGDKYPTGFIHLMPGT